MTTTNTRKKTLGNWAAKLQGETIDMVRAAKNPEWTSDPDCTYYYYFISSDEFGGENQTDDRDKIRQIIADMIREIRNEAIDSRRDRENDELDEAVESIKDADRARKALEVFRAAGLI